MAPGHNDKECAYNTYTHLAHDVRFGDYATREITDADELMSSAVDCSLTVFDRAYQAASFLLDWQ